MTTIFTHPAVEKYLAELDAALRERPDGHAEDLRDQVRAHIEDAVASDASDAEVMAVLTRLGPPENLVVDETADEDARRVVVYTRPSFSGWLGQRSRRWWVSIIAVVTVAAASATAVAIATNVAPLQGTCGPCGFLFAADRNHVSTTSADEIDQDSVAVRFRADQAITFTIRNPSNYTQRVLGDRPDPDYATPTYLQIDTTAASGGGGVFTDWPHGFARSASIPPHQSRQVVVHWIQNFCPEPGAGATIDSYDIRVRALGLTRTETVHIGMAFSVVGSRARGHCRYGSSAKR